MRYSFIAIACLLLAASMCMAQSNPYSSWSNFPQSNTFFPIGTFLQNPNTTIGGSGPNAGKTVAQAMKAMHINIAFDVDGGSGGGGWPCSFGTDCGSGSNNQFANLVAQGLYVMPQTDSSSNTSATSVASFQAIASAQGATSNLIGYILGDEPGCSLSPSVPTRLADVTAYDSSRPTNWNLTDYIYNHGICSPSSINTGYLKAMNIGSYDNYSMVIQWSEGWGVPLVSGQPSDYLYMTPWSVASFVANGNTNQPIWFYGDDGADELAGNTGCSGNLCGSDNHELRATPEQVNAEMWGGLINGAMGIIEFCHDTTWGAPGCMYDATTANNLTYINSTVLDYAPQLNSSVSGRCTMETGPSYTDFGTSCTNGILTMSTGTSTVPGSAIVKNYGGTLYLFADSDRNGSATMTFTLTGHAGQVATVVYDSNAKYDPTHSSVGNTFTLNGSGQFSDTFGANGHSYQPKIYMISGAGANPAAPTGLSVSVN
jgi:hypothetical protein